MSIDSQTLDNPLDAAATQLREIGGELELRKSSIDAGSVRRMLVHLANINHSVLASTRDHLNATKRLKDFALTLTRIAKHSEPPNESLTARMAGIAAILRAASDELTRSNAIPNWQSPAATH